MKPFSIAIVVLSLATLALADEAPTREVPSYEKHIKPLLMQKCAACHGALKQEAGLRLDAIQLIRTGTPDSPIFTAGDATAGSLLERVSAEDIDLRMPPEGEGEALDAEQIELLRQWIVAGAQGPDSELVPASPADHWAYQEPVQAELPDASIHPIDAFLNASHHEAGVQALPPADPFTLMRRLRIDLTGLPPTRDEMTSLARQDSPESYDAVVDRLIATPAYGERWARHWMDVWRYSDWDGYKQELRGSQRHIWRWRDWIIESINDDKGYDQMIREMLAGDEIAPTDLDTLRATGFLARNFHKSNRNIWLDATVEHTAKAFLGTTINCARCHDHKYDPIAQPDYYAMRAIFEPHNVRIERLPGQTDLNKQGLVRAYDAKPDEPTYIYAAGNEKHPDKENPVAPQLPGIFGQLANITPKKLPTQAWLPDSRAFIKEEDLDTRSKRVEKAQQSLSKILAIKDTNATAVPAANYRPPAPPLPQQTPPEEQLARAELLAAQTALASLTARWEADSAKHLGSNSADVNQLALSAATAERLANFRAAELEVLKKSQATKTAQAEKDDKKRTAAIKKANEELAKAKKALAEARKANNATDSKYTAVVKTYPKSSTGRRTAFAEWIANPDNPLTARVAVNHVWLRLMGEPLVANVFDFGLRSPQPRHAALLDWLAVDFMQHDWSLKHLVRTIVTSDAYRRASSVSPRDKAGNQLVAANAAIDADNRLFWRANVRRLDAEVVRDAVLAISGSLDRTVGGPDIPYPDGEKVLRRSVYFQHAYEKQMTMLVLFDAANPTDCYRRSESVIPQQALALTNSALALSESRKLARKLWAECENVTEDGEGHFILLAFHDVLSRGATDDEIDACRKFLASQEVMLTEKERLKPFESKTTASVAASEDPAMRARENLVHVLINHNDFVTLR